MHTDTYLHTLSTMLILGAIILFVLLLRERGVLSESQGVLFSKLVTGITLPALIFDALAGASLVWSYLLLLLSMLSAEMVLLAVAWIAGRALKLSGAQMGTFLLVSAFGSSTLLGYALIVELFPENMAALAEATLVSELGVGLPFFTIGVMIAIHYGTKSAEGESLLHGAMHFFRSPIFLAIVAGLLWSLSPLGTKGILLTPLFEATHIIAQANTFLIALTVGVLLNFSSLKNHLKIAAAVILLKLLLSPLLVYLPVHMMSLEHWQMQVLLLEASMPSAMLSVVLSKAYGCDAKLAAQLVFVTLCASLFTTASMINL